MTARRARALGGLAALALLAGRAAPAQAQAMPGMAMPGMEMPAAATPTGPGDAPAADATREPMPGMDHAPMPAGDAMAGMAMPNPPPAPPPGAVAPTGDAPAPPPPADHYADRFFPAAAMARARQRMDYEQGGQAFGMTLLNLAEYQFRDGRDGYRWDGEAWYGTDVDRAVVKSEGEGATRERLDSGEVQALYSRAVGPYFNLQGGIRQDIRPTPARTYATLGFEGLAPYWFEVSGAAFLSQHGELLGRLEGYYDQRLTQRLVLQPRVELNFAARDTAETETGAGLVNAEAGLRLRFKVTRQFAPYVGVSLDRRTGNTARFARADREPATNRSVVAGLRLWF